MAETNGAKKQWRGPFGMNPADIVILTLSLALLAFVIISSFVEASHRPAAPPPRPNTTSPARSN